MIKLKLTFLFVLSSYLLLAQHGDLLIQHVNYIDVEDGSAHIDQHVLIQDGIIVKISDKPIEQGDIQIVHGSGKWLLPGLVDAHIHLFQSGGLYTRPDAIDLRSIKPYQEERSWLYAHADDILRSYLRLGITTVIDVGGPMSNYVIRDRYKDEPLMPSYYCTGPLVSTYQPEAFQIDDPPIIKVRTIEEAKKIVTDQLPARPDFIKIWYIVTPGVSAADSYDIVKATIDESHKHNLKVAVHATQLTTAKLALKAGADILVHSVAGEIDDEFVDMMKASDAVLVPTLVVHGGYDLAFSNQVGLDAHDLTYSIPYAIGSLLDVEHIDHPQLKEAQAYAAPMLARNTKRDIIRKSNLQKLVEEGVTIATGTDAGNIGTLHASSYKDELEAMSDAQLTNAQIIKASTIDGAKVLDKEGLIGTIEIGKIADLIMMDDNPLEDLTALFQPQIVIKSGELINPDALISASPEDLAQMQLNAYNLGDIESFLDVYSDTVKVYGFPDNFRYQGKEKMRANYASFFKSTPDLHCELINRIVLGNTVVDQELVTGLGSDREIRAIAIYKISDGKIQEVYFDRGE